LSYLAISGVILLRAMGFVNILKREEKASRIARMERMGANLNKEFIREYSPHSSYS